MQTLSSSSSKWLRRLSWLLGAVALLWGLGWLVAPGLIRSQIEKQASEQLGRKVTLGSVDFKPWTLELTLSDLAIANQAGSGPQFAFKRLHVNAELESLLRLAPVVDAVALDAPVLRLTHLGGGKYDIDDIVARLAKPPADKPSDPLHFALFNLVLKAGAVEFEDRPAGKTHALTGLELGVPFVSNLPSRHHIRVEPRLAFNLNGSRFDSQAQTTPFATTRKTDARLDIRDLDLAPYLPYLPPNLPVRLQKGVLAATLQLNFEQSAQAQVRLLGELQLRDLKAVDASGNDVLGFELLKVVLADVRPFEQLVKLSSVELLAPQVRVSRDAAGRLNLDAGGASAVAPAPAAAAAQAAPAPTWRAELARLAIQGGGVQWSDAAVAPQARLGAQELTLEVRDIVWPMDKPASFEGSLAIVDTTADPARARAATKASDKAATKAPAPARLKFSGNATDRQASVKASITDVALGMASPYLAQFLNPVLQGRLRSELDIEWKAPDLKVAVGSLVLDDLALAPRSGPGGAQWPSVRQISLGQSQIDLARRTVSVGKLAIVQPRVAVSRGADKRWMFEDWLKLAAPSAPPAAAAKGDKPGTGGAAADAPWGVVIGDLALTEGDMVFRDEAMGKPVSFGLSAIRLQVKDLRPEGNKPVAMQLAARIKSERGEPGQLDYRGNVQWQPVVAQGALVATQIPLHAFEPYFAGGLNIELLRADAGFKGDLRVADGASGPVVQVKGDAVVEDFRANSLAASGAGLQIAEELLAWKSLSLRGIDLALAPGAAPRLSITETTLGDFFARIIIQETGRINLQNLVKSEAAAAPPVAGASAAAASTPPASAGLAQAAPAASAPVVAAAPTGLEPVISIGPVGLINGKVFFSDRFVKPNYSANLSELTGKLSAFSSVAPLGQPQLADLELRGRAEGTASLEILGKVNPLATPLALDIKGIVRDLELPPLSPYSIKYAGHGIERGKLSVDVAYLILPDGQLTASNKVVLNQLTFGDKVEGAPASLPVKLAVALLADRNGVIDINLPISGSLNDPQFRLGPVIFKVIVNLVVKAITAPFSLLANAFGGGGDELSTVAFAPGSAALLPQAREGLDKVAKALNDRPALKMTVVGTASLEAEREAYKKERLRALLVAEKRRGMLAGNASAAEAGATLTISDAEAPALLKEVYKRADITKPRNLAGVAQDIPLPEMEALLLANIDVTEDAIRQLAVQRGVAVKDYLSGQKLPVERLFLGAVKPVANDPKWTPRAELNLGN
jgi:hypothetical protein